MTSPKFAFAFQAQNNLSFNQVIKKYILLVVLHIHSNEGSFQSETQVLILSKFQREIQVLELRTEYRVKNKVCIELFLTIEQTK